MFDNTLELLYLSGRSLPHAVMMMIPEPWSNHESMDDEKRAFYQYHSSLMEPWDGPASISFTDGTQIGAVLDRNGLRPGRYYVTKDDLVILASEAGVLDVPPEDVVRKGRLQPGKMFLVDTAQGRIVEDEEIKRTLAAARPYREWLDEYQIHVDDLPQPPELPQPDPDSLLQRQVAFGYTFEDQRIVLTPMARDGIEAVGSMGNDTPLAVLSARPRLLYDYFKQLFAQVTNPPIDCIREEIVTSAETRLGSEGNLLNPQPADCRRLELKYPIVTNEEFARIRRMDLPGLRVGVLPILFRVSRGEKGLVKSMEELRLMARRLIEEEEVNVIVLSDRGVNKDFAPIPALMAVAGLHHYLIREGLRTRASLVLETGEAREVHHFALLIGYGVSAINPYLAFETIDHMIHEGLLNQHRPQDGLQELRQGRVQGRDQGRLEDGHLVAAELSRRAGVRGARPAPGRDRRVLQLDRIARRRHRHGRDRAGSPAAAQRRVPGPSRRRSPHAAGGRPVPVARRRRVPPVQPREHPPPAEVGAHGQLRDVQGVLVAGQRPGHQPLHAARPARLQAVGCRADRRSGVDRDPDAALQDRRDVLRLDQQGSARDARDRDEPHRRQEQHGRRRRRSGALRAAAERRFEVLRHQAGGLGPLRRDERVPRQRAGRSRSRWRRARSPARAASCRAPRCTRRSPRPGTRRRASA